MARRGKEGDNSGEKKGMRVVVGPDWPELQALKFAIDLAEKTRDDTAVMVDLPKKK